MIVVTVNGLSPERYRRAQQKPMTEEQHQQRIVRSVRTFVTHRIRNHSGSRSSRGRIIFSTGGAQ